MLEVRKKSIVRNTRLSKHKFDQYLWETQFEIKKYVQK